MRGDKLDGGNVMCLSQYNFPMCSSGLLSVFMHIECGCQFIFFNFPKKSQKNLLGSTKHMSSPQIFFYLWWHINANSISQIFTTSHDFITSKQSITFFVSTNHLFSNQMLSLWSESSAQPLYSDSYKKSDYYWN